VSALKLLAAAAAAVLLHLLGMRFFGESFPIFVDVFLVVVVIYALEGSSLAALFAGLMVGLLHDNWTHGRPYGLFGFADTIIGYTTARLAQRLVIQRSTGVLALVSFAAVAQEAIVAGLAFLLLPAPLLPSPFSVLVQAGICGVLGMLIHIATINWRRSAEARRRGRMSRLRFLG
jgi:rod shape-determining protein MreD